MRYVVFTICLAVTVALIFLLRGDTSTNPSVAQVAQVKQFELDEQFKPVEPLPPVKPEEPNPQPEKKYPCPDFPMPNDNLPLDVEDSKMVVRPDDKIDYKLIVIDPCLPNSVEGEKQKQSKKSETN
jgi:hypothetical protein